MTAAKKRSRKKLLPADAEIVFVAVDRFDREPTDADRRLISEVINRMSYEPDYRAALERLDRFDKECLAQGKDPHKLLKHGCSQRSDRQRSGATEGPGHGAGEGKGESEACRNCHAAPRTERTH
jgi:hypothetical protein